jgi:hypothetical protein
MTVARSAAEVLSGHVTLEVECIDRMYLNLYVPILQREQGIAHFWRQHRGYQFVSSALMSPMSREFVSKVERFAEQKEIDLIRLTKGQRKEDIAKGYLTQFEEGEGVLFIGKAQEKAKVVRTQRRRNERTGAPYPWLYMSTSMVNQFYFYCVDRDFGPFFLKFCSYFPYNAKVCLNGHEYVKRQLDKRGIAYEPLDNGILSCEDPKRLSRICASLTPEKIDALTRKWFARLPHPFPASDRKAGFRYEISMLQAEFSLTQVLDRPVTGRVFFEEIIRENLDIGRPEQVQLIFNHRITRRTKSRFRTRVITDGVVPSLYVDFKSSKIKQYHKESRALRTETVVNNTYDFAIGRMLHNLPTLQEVGFATNRRLLDVQRISYDCSIGKDNFDRIARPVIVEGQRAPGLRFGDPRVLALLSALVLFRLLPRGFANRDLRKEVAPLLGLDVADMTQGKMTYDLRRLRLHGLIKRVPKSHRYEVTEFGIRVAVFLTRAYARLLRPGLAAVGAGDPPAPSCLRRALHQVDDAVERIWRDRERAA